MAQFPFIIQQPVETERRQLARRQDDVVVSSLQRPWKKVAFGVILALLLAAGIWKWRYIVYGPVWLVRAHYADMSDLYVGKTNGRPNLELVHQARNYLSELNQIDTSGNFTSPESLRNLGIRLSAKWFQAHHPDTVDFNPFAPSGQDSYSVTWRYFPGCQQTIRRSFKTRTDWFDRQGQSCSPDCLVTVFMDSSLKLTAIKLTPIQY